MPQNSIRDLLTKSTIEVARGLIGTIISTNVDGHITAGMIVETEAYGGKGLLDPACHAHRGITPRTKVMFGPPGICYVYFIYGMYYCVNIVTEEEGIGAAVLLRAVEPIEGIDVMRQRRKVKKDKDLTNGPGKLCLALGIDKTMLGEDMVTSQRITLKQYKNFPRSKLVASPRIGISQALDFDWRFHLKDNHWISK